jgi:hypothetical protein
MLWLATPHTSTTTAAPDAPWCEMRASHAGMQLVDKASLAPLPPSRKKEKFEDGCMVRGRNEPCAIMYHFTYLGMARALLQFA